MSDEIVVGDGRALSILSASAVRDALTRGAAQFHAATKHGATLAFDTSGGILKRIRAGERPDVVASALSPLQDLHADGLLGAPTAVGVSRIALGVRKGAPVPDIATVEAFKRALVEAPAFARGDPDGGGTAGNHIHAMLDRLGLLEATRSTSILRVGGYKVMAEVAAGRASFGLTQATEIAAVEGVEIGAYLPDDIQLVTTYGIAPGASPRDPAVADAFIAFLSEEGARAFAQSGFQAP